MKSRDDWLIGLAGFLEQFGDLGCGAALAEAGEDPFDAVVVGVGVDGFLAVSSGFGDQVRVDPAWRVDEVVNVSLAA
ncbi:MAG: hypothetical protein ACRDRO_19820 [Pseudonocardiaceae bacterium]